MAAIDVSIVFLYFMATLVIGLYHSRRIKSMLDFAIADRQFSTPVLVATISATLIDGGGTLGVSQRAFAVGIVFLVISMGEPITKLFMAYFIAPNMKRFENMISVGDMMNHLYGKSARMITGISGTLLCIGYIGSQIAAIGYFSEYFLHIPKVWGVFMGCGVIILYSSLGGIKAVTATDIIQFGVLIVAIPLIFMIGIHAVGGYGELFNSIPSARLQLFPPGENPWKYIMLFVITCMPFVNPALAQRLLMAKSPEQIASSMKMSALIEVPFYCIIILIGFIALALQPDLDSNLTFPYLINTILPVGIKGLAIAGMLAVIMSTADSYLHAASITFIHDFLKPCCNKVLNSKAELRITQLSTMLIGVFATIVALYFTSILDIVYKFLNVWGPIIVVPLIAGIMGFKASNKSFLLSVLGGLSTFIIWQTFDLETRWGLESLLPGIFVNAFCFFGSHYWLKPQQRSYKVVEQAT